MYDVCFLMGFIAFWLTIVSWYKYLIVSLVFSHLGFWSGDLFLIAPFPDLCLLVPFWTYEINYLLTYLQIKHRERKKRTKVVKRTNVVYICFCRLFKKEELVTELYFLEKAGCRMTIFQP